MSEFSDFPDIRFLDNHQEIDNNKRWLQENMPPEFKDFVSTPWQTVIANQLLLLNAHEGLDHLMNKDEAFIITNQPDFDDVVICKLYGSYCIESLRRFTSKATYKDFGIITIFFLKITKSILKKELLNIEETFAVTAKTIDINLITLCPHSIISRLIKLLKSCKAKMQFCTCSTTEYQEGYFANIKLELDVALDAKMLDVTKLFLSTNYTFVNFEITFELHLSFVIDALAVLCHQILCQIQTDRFSQKNIEETFLKYADIIKESTQKFLKSVDPKKQEVLDLSEEEKKIKGIDTGGAIEDEKRQIILMLFITILKNILKTNYYSPSKTALSFRLKPSFITDIKELKEKFPEAPYAMFFMKGEGFFSFHIRFKDLSRGGLRTVLSRTKDQAQSDILNVFSECYNLSYTQQKKNKDIPEGGAKGIIFVELHRLFDEESKKITTKDEGFFTQYRSYMQITSQKRYILSLLDLVNADANGKLKNTMVVDLLKRPEHLFLGPDENMSDPMIQWIAETSLKKQYSTKTAFISSKPKAGINHKTYGVTSYGVNTYMEEALKFLKIDPSKQSFTVKISGGPDGDVAGNQMLNLKKYYPNTAKLVAITDVSGTIYDPEGLDLNIIEKFFYEAKAIRFYPPESLHDGGYLLDLATKKTQDQKETILLIKKDAGKINQSQLPQAEAGRLFRKNLHQVKADIFIPAGGRPRTLNEFNVQEFLDKDLMPTSKAIIEGANLYLTPKARRFLEEKNVIIFKDSSANKGGVICSSYEVLAGLALRDDEFMSIKEELAKDILQLIKEKCQKEAKVMLDSFSKKMGYLTDLSDEVSEKINTFKYELLDSLEQKELSMDPQDPLNKLIINYVPAVVKNKTSSEHILASLSDIHRKAIIACHLSSNVVYTKGLAWHPGISELLPLLLEDGTA